MDSLEIRRWHETFKRDGELFEIRIIGERTWSGYFYDVGRAIDALAPYDNFNIYYTVNEVKAACASRDQFNVFRQVKGTATSKQDIEHRWWMPVDVDCDRPSGVSSTDDEKAKALAKAREVFAFLRGQGFSEPVVCDSSSGYHLLYPIDMDNTTESESVVKVFLETLARMFSDDDVKIDAVLYDANRIIRLPGSYGRKGRSTEERPHRMARILSTPKDIIRMGRETVARFNEKFAVKMDSQPRRQFVGDGHATSFNIRDFIARHGIEVAKEVQMNGGGTKFILKECPFDAQHKAPDSALFEMPNGSIAFKCFHNSCAEHDWRAFRLHFEPQAYDRPSPSMSLQPSQPQVVYVQPAPQRTARRQYDIKEELPELGKKWLSLSDIKAADLTQLENVKTGFTELDKRIVGLYMSEVTILSGNNSSGKSSWLNMLILNVIEQGVKVALWTGELRADIYKTWFQMPAAGAHNMRPSQYEPSRYYVPDHIGRKIDEWTNGRFFVYNKVYGTKVEQILHDMEILLKADVRFFILDNLMGMDISMFEGDRNEKQKELILRIKDFAMEHAVHVILVAHPRKSLALLRKPDISGTADITNAVDNVFILHRTNDDFIRAVTEFYDAGRASALRIYSNVLSVEKNRMWGVMDYMCGMYYDTISRRFKNTEYEDVQYGWEVEPTPMTIDYDEATPSPLPSSSMPIATMPKVDDMDAMMSEDGDCPF